MGQLNIVEVEAGVDSWFSLLFFFVSTLTVLAVLTAYTVWSIKLTALAGLLLSICLVCWHNRHLGQFRQLRIDASGAVMLISHSGKEFPGILKNDSWTTRWVSVVAIGRLDRWSVQRLLVCASRNRASDYRQLLKRLRQNQPRDGILV